MIDSVCYTRDPDSIGLILVQAQTLPIWCATQTTAIRQWISAIGFDAKPYTTCLIPSQQGTITQVLVGIDQVTDRWGLGHCPSQLPPGHYHIATAVDQAITSQQYQQLSLSWVLGAYHFSHYRSPPEKQVVLCLDEQVDTTQLAYLQQAYYRVRDLINLSPPDLMPEQFAAHITTMAKSLNAKVQHIKGETLVKKQLYAVHTVGRASQHPPQLVEFTWGDPTHPHIALIGKGVCFDSGGLSIKPSNGMLLMKKDMGGAALALGLAELIMTHQLPVHLHVILPLVENAISGNAYRPSDVIKTHKGLTVEITNTDAEGRLILADALSYAQQDDKLDLIMDFATLTGAARVAVGPDIPSFFTNDETVAAAMIHASCTTQETLWRLPLYEDYQRYLESKVADIKNASLEAYAGAITAALFLQRFVEPTVPWVHVDFMAWNVITQPGRPEGGEAQGLQALFEFVRSRYTHH